MRSALCAQSKSQKSERMKKMMKKFLSSLLALTMILSLVIVPANAAVGDDKIAGVSMNTPTVTLKKYASQDVTFTYPAEPKVGDEVTVNGNKTWFYGDFDVNVSSDNRDVATATLTPGSSTVTIESTGLEGTANIYYTVSFMAQNGSAPYPVTQKLTTKVTVAAPEVTYSITGTPAVKAKVDGKDVFNVKHNTTVDFSIDGDITVKSKTGDTEEVTLTKGKDYTLEYAWTGDVSGSNESVSKKLTNTTSSPKTVTAGCTITVKVGGKVVDSPVKCTAAKVIVASEPSISITGSVQKVGENYEVLKGGRLELTASAPGVENPTYKWYVNDSIDSSHGRNEKYILTASDTTRTGTTTVTCKVFSGDNETPVKETTCTYKIVDEDVRLTLDKESVTLSKKGAYDTVTASVIDWSTDRPVSGEVKYKFTPSKRGVVSLSSSENTTGKTRITLDANDTVTITVEATYKGKTLDAKTIYVTGELLSASLDKVENGDPLKFDYDDLEAAANKALPSRVNVKKNSYINLSGVPTAADEGGVLYYGSNKVSASGRNIDKNDSLEFRTAAGFIGDATMTMTVSGDDNKSYTITLTIPVISAGNIKETVTGNAANKDVTFTNSDYKYLYYTTSKVSDYNGYYTGSSKVGKFDGPVKEDKTVTIPASAFKDKSSVTLNVVGVDKDGVASTGTIEVSQKSYGIKYSVVAGESVTFDQKRFESFMEDYADDNIDTNRGDYFEFDYVKFDSLPNSTREGVLYEGKDKIKTSTEVENLDKVSFESVAKAKDTIKVPFTLYAKQYDKNDKVIDKKVSMTGVVEISVVKEDIVFEVGVNSAVKLGSDKFIDFLRDSDKSYRKADLDYVTFDVGKNSAITSYFNGTGALYRYYNGSTGINATVSAKDEFYYNPKTSSKHYDLDDVTYVTSKFAKVGDIVYIPFTAYGTKSGQKAEGTLAIKVKQTMNFVDVHTYDYFYDSVQWAVNLDITKGTSATTFSPKQGCTRAQIVTFLWRAANSPAPRSSTSKFTDVYATAHADYMKAINWATEQGITTGTGNGKFSPDATCTRAQIVTFLYRFKSNPAVYGSLNFSDVNKTEHAAFYNAILWAVNNKITTGYGNGIFDPNGTCNRGDAVTFLYRALA